MFVSTGMEYGADEVGVLKLALDPRAEVKTGDVGYIITGIKNAKRSRWGIRSRWHRTPTHNDTRLSGSEADGVCGDLPVDTDDFEELRDCMDKLQLNDASLTYELETSQALGFGFRCGFLGMLHMEIIQERLEREFNQTVITTVPKT